MDFFRVIEERYSFRGGYTDALVPESDLRKILDAGLRAPSGCNAQTTMFVVVLDKELRRKIAELFDNECVKTAPALVVAYTKKVTFDFGLNFELEDYAAAVENILLAATALGYGSLWIDGSTRLGGKDAAIAKLLDITPEYSVRCVLPIGVPKNPGKQALRKPFDERVTWR